MPKFKKDEIKAIGNLIKLDPGIQPDSLRHLIDFYGTKLLESLNDDKLVPSRSLLERSVVRALLTLATAKPNDEQDQVSEEEKKALIETQKEQLAAWLPPAEINFQLPQNDPIPEKLFNTSLSATLYESRESPKFKKEEGDALKTLIKLDPGIQPSTLRKLIDFYGAVLIVSLNDNKHISSRNSLEEDVVQKLLAPINSKPEKEKAHEEEKKALIELQRKRLATWVPPKGFEHQALQENTIFRPSSKTIQSVTDRVKKLCSPCS